MQDILSEEGLTGGANTVVSCLLHKPSVFNLRSFPHTYRAKACLSLVQLGVHQYTLPPSPYEPVRDLVCCLTCEDLGEAVIIMLSELESSSCA